MASGITTKSTSAVTAEATEIVLRESNTTRLVFLPTLVENTKNPDAAVSGQFVFQRRGSKNDAWQKIDDPIFLSRLKKGEGVQLDLSTGELLTLFTKLDDLYRLHEQYGHQPGRKRFQLMTPELAKMARLPEETLRSLFAADEQLSSKFLSQLLTWALQEKDAALILAKLQELSPESLQVLNSSANLQSLKNAVAEWRSKAHSTDEEEWQKLLAKHSYVLQQLFQWPVHVISGKAYMGGKNVFNKEGSIVDFFLANDYTKNVTLVEIKTPMTSLIGAKNRNGIYDVASELSAAVMQVLNYREQLQHEYFGLKHKTPDLFDAFDPRCVVIIGSMKELGQSEAKKRTLELFRNNLPDVDIITYSELLGRATTLIKILESGNGGRN